MFSRARSFLKQNRFFFIFDQNFFLKLQSRQFVFVIHRFIISIVMIYEGKNNI